MCAPLPTSRQPWASCTAALGRWGLVAMILLVSGAGAQTARIVLRWKEVIGAGAYELQIAKDSGFAEIVLQTRTSTAAYRWEHLPAQPHWWRVRTIDADGRPSEWSAPLTVSFDSTVPENPPAPRRREAALRWLRRGRHGPFGAGEGIPARALERG